MAEQRTQFDYLLNALEFAAQADDPAKADYGGARRRLFAYVRKLEALVSAHPKPEAWIVHRAMAEPSLEWSQPNKRDCLSAEPLYRVPPAIAEDKAK